MSALKVINVILAAAAVFFAVKAMPAATGWSAGHEVVKWPTSRAPTAADVEAVFAKSGTASYAVLKNEFPDDYKTLLNRIAAAAKEARSSDEAERLGYEATASIRRKYAGSLLNAPDKYLHEMFSRQIELLAAVWNRETPTVCAAFANQGVPALRGHGFDYTALVDQAGAATFRAISAGLKTPDPAGAAADDDWVVIGNRFLQAGGTDHDIQVIIAPLTENPSYCPVLISFLKAIEAEDSAAGHRVRASMAYSTGSQ